MIRYVAAKGALATADDVASYLERSESANQYTNGGPCVSLLERKLRGLLDVHDDKAVVVTCSGTAALHAAVGAFWLVRGNFPFAVQAFTFPCAVQQILSDSCVIDVDDDGGLDLRQVPKHVDGIIVTNSFGHLPDLDRYDAWRRETGKVLILDNASTPFTYWRGQNSVNMGDAAVVSLHHTKPLGFGEGGIVVIDRRYEQALRSCINFGFEPGAGGYPPASLASNFKMSEVAAAYHLAHLDHFDDIYSHQRRLHTAFSRSIRAVPRLSLFPDHGDHTFPSCLPVLFEHPVETQWFKDRGIQAQKYYRPLRHVPTAQRLYERTVCLPLHIDVTDSDLSHYIATCQDVPNALVSKFNSVLAPREHGGHFGQSLEELRDRIDQIDDALLRLLSSRLSATREISDLKSALGLEPRSLERESEILARCEKTAATLGIERESCHAFFEAVLNNSRLSQNRER